MYNYFSRYTFYFKIIYLLLIKKMNIYVDIDNTIAYTTGTDYENAKPMLERIKVINDLYDKGNNITYWTGRGTVSKIDFTELTKKQLNSWGAKYHNLLLGKPPYDIFIDDKSFNSDDYFNSIIKNCD